MSTSAGGAVRLETPLRSVAGGKTAQVIASAFGYETVGDLLGHYPRAYVDREQVSTVEDFVEGEVVTLIATSRGSRTHTYTDRRTNRLGYRTEVQAEVQGSRFVMTYFAKNQGVARWHEANFAAGKKVMVAGKAQWNTFKQTWELINPHTTEKDIDKLFERSRLCPIYRSTAKLTSWTIDDTISLLLPGLGELVESLPPQVRQERDLIDRGTALQWIHAPDDWSQVGAARKRLKFDEAIITQALLARRRHELSSVRTSPRPGSGGLLEAFDQRLPFALTKGQLEVSDQILADLAREHPMHRLLQGDVGSGKTVVALRAMLRVVDSGGQAALLAPTDVLAQQHLRSVTTMLGDLAGAGMLGSAEDATGVTLLTGSMSASARREALAAIRDRTAGIVIGTHALLEETVQFGDLGLVVIDEQHRFGVEQRAALSSRSEAPPHVLVMTATPIPRTVAMTVFGDLETSTLSELPAGRGPIQTSVVPLRDQPAWAERIWSRAKEEVGRGRQVYVVCPRIAAGDSADDSGGGPGDLEDTSTVAVAAVEDWGARLSADLAPLQVGILHGRLPIEAKDQVMRAFAAGDLDVLVSTTVIEVGIDVPNATMMVILDADRFGVSQLHQLRGRIGRGNLPGLCLLVTNTDAESPSRARLDAVAATTDGFELSLLDLRQRREGDLLGTAQSGRSSTMLLSVLHDEDIITDARELADQLITEDPSLASYSQLAAEIARLEADSRADFLEKA